MPHVSSRCRVLPHAAQVGWSLLVAVATGCAGHRPVDTDFESAVVRRAVEFATALVEPPPTSKVLLGSRPVDPSGERFLPETQELAALEAHRRREIAALGLQETKDPFATGCSGVLAPAAPGDAILALNAGQFTAGPWGWLLQEGVVRQPAGTGALVPGVVIAPDGRVTIVPRDSLAMVRGAREGFQSYPTLLEGDGEIPRALRTPGLGVNLTHRDSRLAFGVLRDGRVLIALTRFEGLGGVLEAAPFGFTTPEMAAILGGLGAQRAVLLDGGLSGQMLARDGRTVRRWRGMRGVAAGLVVTPRATR